MVRPKAPSSVNFSEASDASHDTLVLAKACAHADEIRNRKSRKQSKRYASMFPMPRPCSQPMHVAKTVRTVSGML